MAPSPLKSRIGRYTPNELDEAGIEKQLADFAHCAALAQAAGYDGVEIIGSAGYLLSTFLVREDQPSQRPLGRGLGKPHALPGGSGAARARGGGRDFILIFRIAAMDMLDGGLAWDEIVSLGQAVEGLAPTSSARISAGTRRRCRRSPRWCRAPPSHRSPAGCAAN